MNFTEKINSGQVKQGPYKNKTNRLTNKASFLLPPSKRRVSVLKNEDTHSKINWGKGHNSIATSSHLHSDTSASKEDGRIIIALSEGRGNARCEIGIAAINVSQPHLILCQISDTQSYHNTLRKINILNPALILVPMTFVETATHSRLVEIIKDQFPQVTCTPVRRNTYNKGSGLNYIQELCVPSLNSVILVLQYRYYALTAASALLKFLQGNLCIFYANGSIKIDYQESEGYALIDVSTADRLELVSCTKPLQASKYSTLFGVLNNCYTKIGERALRTSILQPPFNTSIILERQKCVSALIKNPEKLQAIQVILQKLSNIDQLLILPTIVIDDSQYWSTRQLNYMLFLNGLFDIITTFKEIMNDLAQPFFKDLYNTLEAPDFLLIKETVRTLLHDNAFAAQSHNGLIQRCFAIKPGINGLLDTVRKIYSERLEEMRNYVKSLGEKYNLPLSLGNNVAKGYHIVFTLNKHQKISVKKTDLPNEFIQVCRLAGSFTMKTMELINYQTRIDDIVTDILKISNAMIFKTLSSFKKYMGLFFKLCEDIANIDVVQSLAEVSIRNNYVKPKFADYTQVENSQHPMLDMLVHERPIPNLISSSNDFNVHIITGPNGSGKSIYIRQVMLIQIMAQIGSYVPATSAIFRPSDLMYARIYLEDNMECGASSFVLEMKEISFLLSHATNNSLIVMDELARSTSLEEGAALAMTICENLADSSAFIYLTSHFTLITKLEDMYLNVKNWHMSTDASGNTPQSLKLDFKYTLKTGVTNLKQYGFFIVKDIWPKDILEDIYSILEQNTNKMLEPCAIRIPKEIQLKYKLESNLRKLKLNGNHNLSKINKLISQYCEELRSSNIILENIHFGKNHCLTMPPVPAMSSKHFMINNGSSFTDLPFENVYFQNVNQDFNSSSYRELSRFIADNSNNLSLLRPDISFSQNEVTEEINDVNRSLITAFKIHQENCHNYVPNFDTKEEQMINNENLLLYNDNLQNKPKINILSNIVLKTYQQDNGNDGFSHIPMNQMDNSSQMSDNFQEFENINEINRSLLNEMQTLRKKITLDEKISLEDVFHSQISEQEKYVDCSFQENPSRRTIVTKESTNAFKFPKPFTKLAQKPLPIYQKKTDDIEQIEFSLPLLQCRYKSSTPIIKPIEPITAYSLADASYNFNSENFEKTFSESKNDQQVHIFPNVIIKAIPNELSQSFGEEDKKQKKSINLSLHKGDLIENRQNLEQLILEETKIFLSDSNDLFDGDSDSLEIAIKEKLSEKNKPTAKYPEDEQKLITSLTNVNDSTEKDSLNKLDNRTSESSSTKNKMVKQSPEISEKKNENSDVRTPVSKKFNFFDSTTSVSMKNSNEKMLSHKSKFMDKSNERNNIVMKRDIPTNFTETCSGTNIYDNNKLYNFLNELNVNSEGGISNSLKEEKLFKTVERKRTIFGNSSTDDNSNFTKKLRKTSDDINFNTPDENTNGISEVSKMRRLENVSSYSSSMLAINEEKTNTSNVNSGLNSPLCPVIQDSNNQEVTERRSIDNSFYNEDKQKENLENNENIFELKNKNYNKAFDFGDYSSSSSIFESSNRKKGKKTLGCTRRAQLSNKKNKKTFGHLKLTKQEIQEEFNRQDEILFKENIDVETCDKYLRQRMNRPSLKQLQNIEHIATIKRTKFGAVVLTPENPIQKPKKIVKTPIFELSNVVDMSIFSDQNADRMSAFLDSNEKNYNLFEFKETVKNKSSEKCINFCSQFVKKEENFNFKRSATFGGFKDHVIFNKYSTESNLSSSSVIQSQNTQDSITFIPDGFYKENKQAIENICSKYL